MPRRKCRPTGGLTPCRYDPFFLYASRTIVLTFRGRDDALTARIELVENELVNARELTTSEGSCLELLQSAAMAIAIAIDPRALLAPAVMSEPPPAEETKPPVASIEPVVAAMSTEDTRPPEPARGAKATFGVMMGPRLATGFQPGAAVGLAVGGALLGKRLSLGVELESFLPSAVNGALGTRATGWLTNGVVVPCFRAAPVSFCGVGRFGRFEGRGQNVADPTMVAAFFLGLGVRAGAEVPLSKVFAVEVTGDLVADFARPALRVGAETLWQAPRIAGALAVSTAYRF